MFKLMLRLLIRLIVFLFIAALPPSGQDIDARMAAVLRYAGAGDVSPDDVVRLSALWSRAQQPGLARAERRLAFRDMYLLYSKLQGRDLAARPEALDGLAEFVMTVFEGGGRMDLTLPLPRGTPVGNYRHVDTAGDGPTPLLLISDLGVDGTKLYASFAARQQHVYTMHVVTLPHAGKARPLPWPNQLDYAGQPWLKQIERELLSVIDQPGLKGVTVVGTAAGGYFAARLALLRGKQIRKAVLVNALVKTPMPSLENPAVPAPLAERLIRAKASPPGPQLFPIAPMPPADDMRRLIADPASTHPSVRNWMAFAVKDPAVSQAWTFEALSGGFFLPSNEYRQELLTTDLTDQMKDLAVPTLAMASTHDQDSPVKSFPAMSQWEELKRLHPTIPLTIVTFADARAYLSADAPAAFDRALAEFLARR